MLVNNLKGYSNNYSETSRILWQYCKFEPALGNNGDITDFNEGHIFASSFKIKEEITC